MDFSTIELDAEHRQLQTDLREFFQTHVTEDLREEERITGNGFSEKLHLAMGEKGWIMPEWPAERGGAGFDPLAMRILELELARTHILWITLGVTRLVTSAVQQFAQDSIRDDVLADVASGHARFCLGYTEPDGGSDIAAAKTRAVRDGDEWVINGSKIFTTGAHQSQYVFLITRTDPDLPKHKGLTMFLVPLNTPGIEIQGIWAFSGERTNVVYYDNVRISDKYRLGDVNGGWGVLHGPLDEEHSLGELGGEQINDASIAASFLRELHRAIDETAQWAHATTRADGTRPADDPVVAYRLGKVAVDFIAALVTPGPLGRVRGSEALVKGAAELLDLQGPVGLLNEGEKGAFGVSQAHYAHRYAQGTATYGGTVEVFRTIIAQHVLGLPKPSYPGSKYLPSRAPAASQG